MINNLMALIRFQTTHEVGHRREFKKFYSFVDRQLKGLPLKKKVFQNNGYTSYLWSTDENPKILLAAHVDVVPASVALFHPKVTKNRLYGRGALDMKFAVAVFIEVFKNLKNLNQRSVGLLLTPDEEIGGTNGVNYIIQTSSLTPNCVLLPDGGVNMSIEHAEKGVWHVRLITKGKTAHGSRPWLGENAIDKLVTIYQALKEQFPNPITNQWVITLNAGKIQGGTATNMIADTAYLNLDIRLPQKKDRQKVEKTLREVTRNRATFQTLAEVEPFYLSEKNSYLKKYLNVAKKTLGKTPSLIKSAGSSDACFFAKRGIPVILSQPIGGGHHTAKEWISIKSLEQYYEIVKNFIVFQD